MSRDNKSNTNVRILPTAAPSPGHGGRWKWQIVAGVAVLLIAAFAVMSTASQSTTKQQALLKEKASAPAPAPVLAVTVQPASINSIERTIEVNGSVSAWDPITVGAEEGGLQINSIFVDESSVVKKGQVLAKLDATMIEPQLESEEARLKASLASEKKALQPNRPEDINGLSAAVEQAKATVEDQESALVQAQANLADAKQNYSRYVLLQKDGAVSKQEMETRLTTAKVAEATVRSAEKKISAAKFSLQQAKERLSMAKSGGRIEDIQIANANTLEIQGNIKRLRAQLDRTTIKAPVDGIIIKRDAHIGDIAVAGKSMFAMARDNRLELRAQVPETDLPSFKNGQTVKITSALSGKRVIPGKLREVSPIVDADTRLGTVRIDIPKGFGVKPGTYAEGHIDVGRHAGLTVPAPAVISEDDKSIVFVLHKNIVERRIVVTGSRTNDLIEISSGLRPGEQVVVTGAGFLKDGDCVSLAKTSFVAQESKP